MSSWLNFAPFNGISIFLLIGMRYRNIGRPSECFPRGALERDPSALRAATGSRSRSMELTNEKRVSPVAFMKPSDSLSTTADIGQLLDLMPDREAGRHAPPHLMTCDAAQAPAVQSLWTALERPRRQRLECQSACCDSTAWPSRSTRSRSRFQPQM